jgi:hypothetical protein
MSNLKSRSIIKYFLESIPVIPGPIVGSPKDFPRVSGQKIKSNKLFTSFSANPKSDLMIEKEQREQQRIGNFA